MSSFKHINWKSLCDSWFIYNIYILYIYIYIEREREREIERERER